MSQKTLEECIAWAVLLIVGFAVWRYVSQRRAKTAVSDEIAARQYDATTMAQALVDAGGDNQKARKRYIRLRLREERRRNGKSVAKEGLQFLACLWVIGFVIYHGYRLYTGEMLWWLYQ